MRQLNLKKLYNKKKHINKKIKNNHNKKIKTNKKIKLKIMKNNKKSIRLILFKIQVKINC